MSHRKDIENDIWFANQLDAIRQMTPPHEVDVTDAVMQRIESLQPLTNNNAARRHMGYKIAFSMAAACIAAVMVITMMPTQKPAILSTDNSYITSDISDIYGFCMSGDNGGDAFFGDNPIFSLI